MSSVLFKGWLLDLYLNQQDGITLWFISEADDQRACFTQTFPVSFYAAGPSQDLRQLWKKLQGRRHVLALQRLFKQDVFVADPVEVMEITVDSPALQADLFRELEEQFPDLTWYDADVTISTRYIARYGAFPMAFCQLEADEQNQIQSIQVLNSRWDLLPELPPLRVLELSPDTDPTHNQVHALHMQSDRLHTVMPLDPKGNYLHTINNALLEYDPDILITDWGDGWLLPFLLKESENLSIPLALNRDPNRPVRWQKEITYFSYGHIIYRPEEAHLFGRCHIDRKSAIMWSDYSLAGTLEMARVTTLPIEKAARVSPGQGISAMQVITALEKGILVPYQKRQVEEFKSGMQLIQADRGGMIYQPKVGLHYDVAQVDFVSMYPAIIIRGNISPEVPLPDVLTPAQDELGVVPLTLKPIYEKRVALKTKTRSYPPEHPMAKTLKARSSALKWLLVVCFGFLGYKNARYGRIEAHEAVTRGGREVLLRAKEVAEAEGFEVLHMYVDALWLKKGGCSKPEHFDQVMQKIVEHTGLAISLDGVYRWVAFLPSKTDARIPVANRYFGVFQSGEMKVRGLESRRRDTPRWIGQVQKRMIDCIGKAKKRSELKTQIQQAFSEYRQALAMLKEGRVPLDQLVVNGKVSYALDAYKSSTPSVRAARQMEAAGISVRPGQRIRFLYIQPDPGVIAWELGDPIDVALLDIRKYTELLAKAGGSILLPFGVDPELLIEWSMTGSVQLPLGIDEFYSNLENTAVSKIP